MIEICEVLRRKLVYRKPVFVVLFFLMFLTLFFAQVSSAGHNNSSLSGTYVMYIFNSGFNGGDPGAWGENDELRSEKIVFIFDGAGNFTSSFTEAQIERALSDVSFEYNPGDWVFENTYNTGYTADSDTNSGTYSVASDGTVTITLSDGGGTAMLSSDGNTFIFSEAEFDDGDRWGSVSFGVGVKQGSGFNNSSLSGTYVMHIFNSGFQGVGTGGWGTNDEIRSEELELIFDGAGNVTASFTEGQIERELSEQPLLYLGSWVFENTYNTTYSIDSDTDSGTYTVTNDGTITITLSDGGGTAMLSADGNTFIFSEAEFEVSEHWGSVSFGVGVKQGSGFDNSDLSGTYVMHIFNSGFQGGAPGAWGENDEIRSEEIELIFDGAGNVTASFTEGEIERELSEQPFLYLPGDYVFENTYNTTYSTDSDTDSGTYSVASDGTITITLSDGGGTAMLSSDGNTFIFSEAEFEDSEQWGSISFGIGVKQIKGYGDELALDFGAAGLWDYDGASWALISGSSPEDMSGWSGGLAMDFGTSGLWNFDGTTWTPISGSNVQDITDWANGLATDFGASGVWNYDGSWASITGSNPEDMAGWSGGLAMDFGASGVWSYDGTTWSPISGSSPEAMVGWSEGLAMDFGASGLWSYDGSTWALISSSNVEDMADWANGLSIDFGASGVWNYDGSSWSFTSGSNPQGMLGWSGGLAMDFGASGLWNYDGTTWGFISSSNVEDMDDVDLY
jgi:hypothetical protein